MKQFLLYTCGMLLHLTLLAQTQPDIILPDTELWNVVKENEVISFKVKATTNAIFYLHGAEDLNIQFDTLGNFHWKPSFDLVDRVSKTKDVHLIFEAHMKGDKRVRKTATLTVVHVNRPPVVEELPVFYVKQGSKNTYQIPTEYFYDADGDPVVFRSIASQMPEGSSLTSQGQFIWSPSRIQFNNLKTSPLTIEFVVQDQPEKLETRGRIRIAQTQLDLPPEILIVPPDSIFSIKEDETLNLKIYLSDPNGDENVRAAGIIPSDPRISTSTLKENTPLQYEFTWTPGYHYVDDTKPSQTADIIFFAVDKSNNRAQRKIRVRVNDTENLVEKDGLQYMKYRNNLIAAAQLLNQLDNNQKKLNEDYKKARQGKKKRSVLNATLGAATGLSPITLEADQAKVVSGIGGTTVLTLGTLEATEVIGRSKDAIMERIRIGIEVRNKIQAQGDEFARKYGLKSSRRNAEFEKDIDKLRAAMNDQRLVLLELDAYTRNRTKVDNKEVKKIFIDFSEE